VKRRPFTSRAQFPLSPTEFLLLAILQNTQLHSLYALREQLGLSPGAIVPALRGLMTRGLVKRESASTRGKKPFSITEAGRLVLQRDYDRALAEAEESDLDSAVRAATALKIVGSPLLGVFLDSAVRARKDKAQRLRAEAQRLGDGNLAPGGLYPWARALATSHQLEAEASAIEEIAARFTGTGGSARI
jgi:DNA-binding MarR family transcriptional regulator